MIFFGLPETKQMTLEELDYIFAVVSLLLPQTQGSRTADFDTDRNLPLAFNSHLPSLPSTRPANGYRI